jgi:acetylglutamate kinase
VITDADRAQVLIEALPYIRRYSGKTFVIKYGGAAMIDEDLKRSTMQDIVLMRFVGLRPVLVHGGGPDVSEVMQRWGKEPVFVNGLRVTDAETADIVEMVLAGRTNKRIVSLIHRQGGRAVGLSGKDGDLLIAERFAPGGVDIGFVGEIREVRTDLLSTLAADGYIPVISSVAGGPEGETFNINADHVAGRLAGELVAEKLILLTDVRGILDDVDRPESLIPEMAASEARRLLNSGKVGKGMIPKVEACLMAIDRGVPRAHIIDGRTAHGLLTEIFTDRGVGTMITAG